MADALNRAEYDIRAIENTGQGFHIVLNSTIVMNQGAIEVFNKISKIPDRCGPSSNIGNIFPRQV